jgi:predicted house-cleaning noncanonical NTP pyrophosphatase (MazG superfamily)
MPEICRSENQQPDFYEIINDQEFFGQLINKLKEEVNEMIEAPSLEEAADILEVLLTIGTLKGYGEKDLLLAAATKRQAKGGFIKRFYLRSLQESRERK